MCRAEDRLRDVCRDWSAEEDLGGGEDGHGEEGPKKGKEYSLAYTHQYKPSSQSEKGEGGSATKNFDEEVASFVFFAPGFGFLAGLVLEPVAGRQRIA